MACLGLDPPNGTEELAACIHALILDPDCPNKATKERWMPSRCDRRSATSSKVEFELPESPSRRETSWSSRPHSRAIALSERSPASIRRASCESFDEPVRRSGIVDSIVYRSKRSGWRIRTSRFCLATRNRSVMQDTDGRGAQSPVAVIVNFVTLSREGDDLTRLKV